MPLTHSGTILVCGLEQIGCTIATGLCKSGDVKKIYLYDKETVTNEDVETMTEYYAGNDVDIKTRGEAMTNYLINRFDVEVETFLVDLAIFFEEVFFLELDFLLDFFAANNSMASSIEISSAPLPSGREAFTFPCLTYKP